MNPETISPAAWLAAGWTMLHFLWIGTLAGLIAGLGRKFLLRASPEARHAFTLCCFLAFAATPAILFAQILQQLPVQDHPVLQASSASPSIPFAVSLDAIPLTTVVAAPTAESRLATIAGFLPWIWMCGFPLAALWLATGCWGVRRWRSLDSTRASPALARICQHLARRFGIRRRVQVRLTDRLKTPVLIGLFKPCILFPIALANSLSPAQVEMVLLHELAHLRRLDDVAIFVQRMVECVLFFHPVTWMLSRWLQCDREARCDRWVLEQTGEAAFYAETLWTVAARSQAVPRGVTGMAGGSLRERIQQVLNSEEISMSGRNKLFAPIALLSLVPVALAAVPFQDKAEKPRAEAADKPAVAPPVALPPVEDPAVLLLPGVKVRYRDLDNDGDLDLYVANSAIAIEELPVAIDPALPAPSTAVAAPAVAEDPARALPPGGLPPPPPVRGLLPGSRLPPGNSRLPPARLPGASPDAPLVSEDPMVAVLPGAAPRAVPGAESAMTPDCPATSLPQLPCASRCTDCHVAGSAHPQPRIDPHSPRFVLKAEDCANCHANPHAAFQHPPAPPSPALPEPAPAVFQRIQSRQLPAPRRARPTETLPEPAPSVFQSIQSRQLPAPRRVRLTETLPERAPRATQETYQVAPGDTLESIARRILGESGSWQRIAEENQVDPRRLSVGQRLVIPRGRRPESPATERLIDALNRVNLDDATEHERRAVEEALRRALERVQESAPDPVRSRSRPRPPTRRRPKIVNTTVQDVTEESVTLSAGRNESVEPGDTFEIYRDDTYLGRVRVNEVSENQAEASVQLQAGRKLKKDDKATTRLE